MVLQNSVEDIPVGFMTVINHIDQLGAVAMEPVNYQRRSVLGIADIRS